MSKPAKSAAKSQTAPTAKITRGHLIQLYHTLGNARDIHKTLLARASALALRKRLEVIVEPFLELQKAASAPVAAFDSERIAICREMADRDENGNPVEKDNTFVIMERKDEFDTALRKLRVTYKDALEAQEKTVKEFNEFIVEKIDLPDVGQRLKFADLTNNATLDQLDALWPVIDGLPPV